LFTVRRGPSILARLLAAALRLPAQGDDVLTRLVVEPRWDEWEGQLAQTWTRTFGARTLSSLQYAWHGEMLAERFRFIEVRFRLSVDAGALRFEQLGAALVLGRFRLEMPRWLWPQIYASVGAVPSGHGQMEVRVVLSTPITGMLLAYAGCIRPEAVSR
jgi:hypothetical protein